MRSSSRRRAALPGLGGAGLSTHGPRAPFEESVGTLAALRRAGKIRLLGLSNVTRTQIEVAMRITEIVSVQNELSLLARAAEQNGTVAFCAERRLTFLAYRPLAG